MLHTVVWALCEPTVVSAVSSWCSPVCAVLNVFMKASALPQKTRRLLDHITNKHVLLVSQLPACTCKALSSVSGQTKPGTASARMVATTGAASTRQDALEGVLSSIALPELQSCLFCDLQTFHGHCAFQPNICPAVLHGCSEGKGNTPVSPSYSQIHPCYHTGHRNFNKAMGLPRPWQVEGEWA